MQVKFVTCLLMGSQVTTYNRLQATMTPFQILQVERLMFHIAMLQPVILITCLCTVRCWQKCTEWSTIGHSILVYNFEQVRGIVGHFESVTFLMQHHVLIHTDFAADSVQ